MKRFSIIEAFGGEDMIVEIVKTIEVAKATTMKDTLGRDCNHAKKIGVEKDVIEEEMVD